MDKFLQNFKNIISLFCFVAVLCYGKFNIILIIIVSTIVGLVLFITPEEGDKIKEIFNGFKTAIISKITRKNKKV